MTLEVNAFWLAIAIKVPLILSATFAPYVGYFSDRFESPWGRRRPFILVFPWLSFLFFGLIWSVPNTWSESKQLIYFSCMVTGLYFSNTLWVVPLKSMVFESTKDYVQRTRLFGLTNYFQRFGALVASWLYPLSQLTLFGGIALSLTSVGWIAGFFIIGLLGALPAILNREHKVVINKSVENTNFKKVVFSIIKIRNFQIILVIIITQALLNAFSSALDFYVIVYYMFDGDISTGAIYKSILTTCYVIFGFLFISFVVNMSAKFGKVKVLKVIYLVTIVGGLAKWFIFTYEFRNFIFLDPLLCCAILVGNAVLLSSMVADVADEDNLHSGEKREGTFVALNNWIMQIFNASSFIIAGLVIQIIGLNSFSQDDSGATTILRILLVSGTTLSGIICLFVIGRYDIDESRHLETMAAIKKREQQQN